MLDIKPLHNFASNIDIFGIKKSIDVEIEYEIDPFDGSILIDTLILKLKHDYNKHGKHEPHYETLRLNTDWLSDSTLGDLVDEIEIDLEAKKADDAAERARDQHIERWLDAQASVIRKML